MEAVQLLDALGRVGDLQFTARSASPTGWRGSGSGSVAVDSPEPEVVIFRESGLWRPEGGGELRFSNVYRWSVVGSRAVRLEHLRFGPRQPVLLFDLAPESEEVWSSVSAHQCRDDCYSSRLRIQVGGILVRWAIVGPQKREDIEYIYRWRSIV
jgi:Family of unknown function (DUF6314)